MFFCSEFLPFCVIVHGALWEQGLMSMSSVRKSVNFVFLKDFRYPLLLISVFLNFHTIGVLLLFHIHNLQISFLGLEIFLLYYWIVFKYLPLLLV